MEANETPHWSYSSLNCYLQCPMKYAFRYVEHAPVERTGVCFPYGRAFHATLSERALKGVQYKLEDAKENFELFFKAETDAAESLCYKQGEDFDSCVIKAGEMLAVALDNWQDDYLIKSVAEPFEIAIPGLKKPLIGEFDMVVEEGGHDTCIVDWKTSSSRWPAGKADYEQQATAYCYAYREKFGKNPLFRYDVITKTKQPQIGSWYTVRTKDELNRFADLCRQVERCVNAEAFYRVENQLNCGECPYRNRCHRKGAVSCP